MVQFKLYQLHQTALGLAYLHGEGIVHGDLHGVSVRFKFLR